MLLGGIIAVVVVAGFVTTLLLLLVTMLPTIVAYMTDTTRHRARVLAVGAMNLAGAAPFALELLRYDGDFAVFRDLLTFPVTYCVALGAAALGALIDWATVGAVSAMLLQRAQRRLRRIEVRQREIAERWGADVAGTLALGPNGLPVGQPPAPQ